MSHVYRTNLLYRTVPAVWLLLLRSRLTICRINFESNKALSKAAHSTTAWLLPLPCTWPTHDTDDFRFSPFRCACTAPAHADRAGASPRRTPTFIGEIGIARDHTTIFPLVLTSPTYYRIHLEYKPLYIKVAVALWPTPPSRLYSQAVISITPHMAVAVPEVASIQTLIPPLRCNPLFLRQTASQLESDGLSRCGLLPEFSTYTPISMLRRACATDHGAGRPIYCTRRFDANRCRYAGASPHIILQPALLIASTPQPDSGS